MNGRTTQVDKEEKMRGEDDVYYRLGMRLNEAQVKMLLVEPFFQLLEQFYTRERAEFGAKFPLGAFTVWLNHLMRHYSRSESRRHFLPCR